jgi:hypothetical protein
MIRDQERDRLFPLRQPGENAKRGWSGVRGHHTIAIAVPLPQISFHGAQNIGVVIDGE